MFERSMYYSSLESARRIKNDRKVAKPFNDKFKITWVLMIF
jgi:hypothetical protein